jgi:prophage regulatory protein
MAPQRCLLRLPRVLDRYGSGKSKFYQLIKEGLFTPPIDIGGRSVAWPDNEVDAIISARIAGKSDAEIRTLVCDLLDQRKTQAKIDTAKGKAA